jgi:release factor glutamine methyltransferase
MKRHELSLLLNSSFEAKILLQHVFNLTGSEVILRDDFDETTLNPSISRLQKGEPLARIIGNHEFYGASFTLNEATLIPRADSETLIDAALLLKPKHILDLGTGSGCLLITLIRELKASGIGVDISARALEAARQNAGDLRAKFIQSDWFSNVSGTFDLIISNPPYIARDEVLDKSALYHDPPLALFAENNGLACYEIIFKEAHNYLTINGHIIVEIGYRQYDAVVNIAQNNGFTLINQYNDLGGHIRALTFIANMHKV